MSDRLVEVMQSGFATLADLIGETNARLEQTNNRLERLENRVDTGFAELGARIDQTNQRLDQTNKRLDQTNQRLDQTNQRLGSLEGRFDHFLETGGRETRQLREDYRALDKRLTKLEEKAA